MNRFYYMAFDPGEKTTGLATFNENASISGIYSIKQGLTGVMEWLELNVIPYPYLFPKKIICETYRINDFQFNHFWSKVPTIRVIGVIEAYCKFKFKAEWIEQEPKAYKDGVKWSGNDLPPGRQHCPDTLSALGHGVYYLYKHEKKWEIKL